MSSCQIIDAFPAFLSFWASIRGEPIDVQISAWATEYMSQWPDLLNMQRDDYASQDVDWREIARDKVFPFLDERLPVMRVAHQHLLASCASTYARAEQVLRFQSDVVFVIYVGIGCGAGWVEPFRGSPAVLFGLENIAECGWSEPPALTGLVAHEVGHLAHDHWRAAHGRERGAGPWWQLYSEGFAQRCEHVILGQDTWHEAGGVNDADWLNWCHEHKSWLAAEFLWTVDAREPVRPFFGSWFDLRGRRQCGYFLGHELIRDMEATADLREIALLDNVEQRFRRMLRELAGLQAQEQAAPCETRTASEGANR